MGGNAVLNAYMAGPNGRVATYVNKGVERSTNEVENWYGFFSGATVRQFWHMDRLKEYVAADFIPAPEKLK